ncbi:hypothetical protein NLI96_g7186 [Meripilus lineatus]|uniref:Large ribosomal subunit protein mL46 n=1 Tax=Meripilus lineatus TaxID=2056292 RepID=A0AAD5V1W5_9APHY|nr:hypothetical protein NLI96_g7186 [Physisporinus lineatus]
MPCLNWQFVLTIHVAQYFGAGDQFATLDSLLQTKSQFRGCGGMFARRAISSCRKVPRLHTQRTLATVADTPSTSNPSSPPAPKASSSSTKPTISTSIILNRSPFLTRTPTKFEQTYYSYHSRIQRALHNPFPLDFYFKQGSLLEGKFLKEEDVREREAFGGRRNEEQAESSQAGVEVIGQEEEVKPMPRVSEADKTGDVRSLDRNGERNLYLLLRVKDGENSVWRFPQGGIQEGELLHEAAHRDLKSQCGTGMDTWVVSRKPIGVYQSPLNAEDHVFFYKAHILAGQVKPDGVNVTDFAWLTKQEIKTHVSKSYWTGVKDMLSDF